MSKSLRDDRIANIASMKQMAALYGNDKPAGNSFIEEAESHVGKARGRYGSPEHDHQVALFKWWRLQHKIFGVDEMLMFAIPNGGARDAIVAARLKAEGVTSGVWDIFLSVPRGKYHGLYVEMKYGTNKLSERQQDFGAAIEGQGYANVVCYSSASAHVKIKQYLTTGTIE